MTQAGVSGSTSSSVFGSTAAAAAAARQAYGINPMEIIIIMVSCLALGLLIFTRREARRAWYRMTGLLMITAVAVAAVVRVTAAMRLRIGWIIFINAKTTPPHSITG